MEACDNVYSADYLQYNPLEGELRGIDAFKESFRASHEQYSSINLSINQTFIKGGKVAVLWTWKSTFLSGEELEASGNNLVRIEDGKIAEMWIYYYDPMKLLEQMGFKIIPPEEKGEE